MTTHPEKHPRQAQLEAVSMDLAHLVSAFLETKGLKGTGFAVELFDFGERGHLAYVSNANREDMAKALVELVGQLGVRI
jgi:hypothetical protein